MLFSSLTFLLLFFPLVILIYYVMPSRFCKNLTLLVFSLIFYAWGEPKMILLMLALLTFNYFGALYLDTRVGKARLWMTIFIVAIDLSSLFYYKYFNFTISNLNQILNTEWTSSIVLPIGISFYLFQIISYVIDVYRKDVSVQKSFLLLSTYISLFPQLIAGPIVRYSTVERQLQKRNETWEHFYLGLRRFIIGLAKKVILSNNVAIISNMVFTQTALNEMNFTLAWMGAISYTLQIYFDFSGYSDMAIGLGKMFGFDFLENFNYPYTSLSITDFWRRWHISLSTWFRDYVYIPLGGNRRGMRRQIVNILIVWALTGLWHGAAWNFVLWGLYFALILIIEKQFLLKILHKLPKFVQWVYAIILIVIGWVIFNSTSVSQVVIMVKNMFSFSGIMSISEIKNMRVIYLWPYFVAAFIGCFPLVKMFISKLSKFKSLEILINLLLIFLLYWSIVLLVNNSYNPFIYYRF